MYHCQLCLPCLSSSADYPCLKYHKMTLLIWLYIIHKVMGPYDTWGPTWLLYSALHSYVVVFYFIYPQLWKMENVLLFQFNTEERKYMKDMPKHFEQRANHTWFCLLVGWETLTIFSPLDVRCSACIRYLSIDGLSSLNMNHLRQFRYIQNWSFSS